MTGRSLDVSVILATRNQAPLLAATLSHLAAQEVGALRWELIVVDNGSTDPTPAVLRSAATRLPLVALREPVAGKNRAMNRALAAARGSLLLFTDDDVIPDRRWIAEMVAAAERWPKHVMFGGQILLAYPPSAPAWLRQVVGFDIALARFSFLLPERPIEQAPVGPSYAIRARAISTRRFDETIGPGTGRHYAMGSETEFLQRLARATGTQAVYVPTALVQHVLRPYQLTPSYLRGRMFRLGRGMSRMRIDDPALGLRTRRRSRPFLGAPRYLWREAFVAAIQTASRFLADPASRLRAELRLAFLIGCIYEYRAQSKVQAQIPLPAFGAPHEHATMAEPTGV